MRVDARIMYRCGGATERWTLVEVTTVADTPDFDSLIDDIASRRGVNNHLEFGFKQVDIGDADRIVSCQPFIPATEINGFELSGVYHADTSTLPPAFRSPPSEEILLLVYRRGIQFAAITNQKMSVDTGVGASEGGPMLATPEHWSDPVMVAEPTRLRVELEIDAPPFRTLTADTGITPHTWAIIGDAVVSIEGRYMTPDELITFIQEATQTADQ